MQTDTCSEDAKDSLLMWYRLPGPNGPDDCASRRYWRKLSVYLLSFAIMYRGVNVITLLSLYCTCEYVTLSGMTMDEAHLKQDSPCPSPPRMTCQHGKKICHRGYEARSPSRPRHRQQRMATR